MEILYQDRRILVCYKEAGLPVQSANISQPDLESRLRTRLRESGEADPAQLRIVHRLDQPVQGLLVMALTQEAAAALSAQTGNGRMEKSYLALTGSHDSDESAGGSGSGRHDSNKSGSIPGIGQGSQASDMEEGTLEDWLLRDGKANVSRVVSARTAGAKKARLRWQDVTGVLPPLCTGESGGIGFYTGRGECPAPVHDLRVLRIRLLTGRHHQIRVQLSHAGMPIIGDRKYAQAAQAELSALRYPALCACSLAFDHPDTGKRMTFSLPPEQICFL